MGVLMDHPGPFEEPTKPSQHDPLITLVYVLGSLAPPPPPNTPPEN